MKNLQLIAMLCCFAATAQEKKNLQFEDIDELRSYQRVMIEAGARVPLDKLSDKMGVSPEIGFWFRSRLRNKDMFDVGFTLCAPSGAQDFDYSNKGMTYKVNPAGVSGMAGFRVDKVYPLSSGAYKKSVEWISSFGYAYFMYRDRDFRNPDRKTELKALNTFHVGQGLRFNIDNIGFQANYNYTPYAQFSSHVPDNFGAHSLTIGIVYRQ